SCVHQHWMLVRLAVMFPQLHECDEIRRVLNEHLTEENMAVEAAYFQAPGREFFERPYGWAWLLKLAQEVRAYDATLEANMAPLVTYIRTGFACMRACSSSEQPALVATSTAVPLAFTRLFASM
ncbi:MAG: DUF2891 family protein, partial [Opitutus sp.]